MWNSRLDEAQAGIKTARRNINNLRYTDDTSLMAESKEELKIILMKVKEESEKAGLKLNIQRAKMKASSPIIPWQINVETPWRRKWQPTPVFLPGKFHGQRNVAGYSRWGGKESATTEHISTNGETMETVTGFIFLGSKITVDGDCSHEIKWLLLFVRKAVTNVDCV